MVIVLGHTGYIGTQFIKELKDRGIESWGLSRSDYDYYDYEVLRDILAMYKPDFLINAAGYTGKPNVDACEENQDETVRGNVTLPKIISEACKATNTPWGHVSSGCIYNGYEKEYTEKDKPNFSFSSQSCSFYSGTKADGEEIIGKIAANYYIWRLRIPFDEYSNERNYLNKIKKYPMLLNVDNSISHRGDFVKYSLDLWLNNADYGIYNVTNTGHVSTKEIANKMNEIWGLNKNFKYFETEREMYRMGFAKTPRSSCILSNLKLKKALKKHNINVRTAKEAVEHALKNWDENNIDENSSIHKSFWE